MRYPFLLRMLAGSLAAAMLLGISTPRRVLAPRSGALVAVRDEGLDPYLTQPAPSKEATDLFLRAARAARAGQDQAAERAYLDFAKQAPVLADWAYVLAADAAARRGDTAAARTHLRASSEWLAREWGWRTRVRALRTAGSTRAAAALAAGSAEEMSLATGRLQARRNSAELLLAAGDTTAARALLRTLVADARTGLAAPAAAQLIKLSANGDDLLHSARVLLLGGDHKAVTLLLPRLLGRPSLAGAERADVRVGLARLHFNARRYTNAESVARALAADSTEPAAQRAEARVLLARTLLRRGQSSAAITQLKRALESKSPTAIAEAAFVLGDLQQDQASLRDSAANWYRLSAASAPATLAAGEAMMRLGVAWFAASRYDSALHWFERVRTGPASMQQRAAYWSARVRLAQGGTGADSLLRQVIALDPVSYYGLRASEQLGQSAPVAVPAGPASTVESQLHMARAFARWDLLRRADLPDAAAFELERLRRSFLESPALYDLAELMQGNEQTQRAISIGRELQRKNGQWDERLLRIVYPLPFQKTIEGEAARQGIDPYLAAALIRQESGFNPRATSVAGARGLMQLMPKTGQTIARQASVKPFTTARLYDPELNVKLGVHHLKSLLHEYSGKLTHVLSAYNAGAHRLAQWRDFPEAIDDDLFAERIPFTETRDYVRIVQQNAHIYRFLYSDSGRAAGPENR